MKFKVLLIAVIFISTAGFVQAEELQPKENPMNVTLDLTYTSKWLSKGAEAYGSDGGFFKTIDINWGPGFGIKVTHRNSTSSGHVDKQRFDYRPYYKGSLFEGQSYATKYNLSVGYEHYPGLDRKTANTTFEWVLALHWPDLLPAGFVPCYIVHYEYPAGSGYTHNDITGWVHRFILGYDFNAFDLPEPISLTTEVAYNDGLGGTAKDHDWAYATVGLSTTLKINENLSFVPGIYHQVTMDDSTSGNKDITYSKLSMKYKF